MVGAALGVEVGWVDGRTVGKQLGCDEGCEVGLGVGGFVGALSTTVAMVRINSIASTYIKPDRYIILLNHEVIEMM